MDPDFVTVRRTLRRLLVPIILFCAPSGVAARPVVLDLPAGSLGDAVMSLGRQAQVDIVIDDAALWSRHVAAIRGSLTPAGALRRLLTGASARAIAVGPDSWRIRTVRKAAAQPRPRIVPIEAIAPPSLSAAAPDIVVTASKRDLRLRDFPGTVSILDGADLAFGGPGGTDAILSRLASVSSTYLGAGRNKLFIRGIADSSFTGPTQATVGQYFGDLRLTYNAPDPDLRLYDIASVEVLEGPQGTLYGAGSMGGIIRTVPNPPVVDKTSASLALGVSATQHGAPGGDAAAMVNLPIVDDRIALRLVGDGVSDGGYIDNPLRAKNNINRTNIAGGRATLRIVPADGWTIDLGGVLQRNHGDDSQYADVGGPPLTRSSPIAEGFNADYTLGDIVIAKDWDTLRFRSSTNVVHQNLSEAFDASPADAPPRVFTQHNATRLITTEARLWRPVQNGVGWVLGASYIDNRTRLLRALGAPGATLPVTGVDNGIIEGTLYGEASVALRPWLTATAGGRAAFARLSGGATDVLPAPSLVEELARAQITADRHSTSLLPSLAVTATPLDRLTLYIRYQEGFRPGGLAIESGFVQRFEGDRVKTIEAGTRYGSPGPHAWNVAASLSATRWSNIQADFIDDAGLPSTANIGNGRLLTLSGSASWRPLVHLRLDAALAFNASRVTEPSEIYRTLLVHLANTLSEDMRRIPNIARVTGRIGFDWEQPLQNGLDLRIFGWGRYVGRSRLGIGPTLGEEQGNYTDSALTARVGTPSLGVNVGLTNLTDSIGNRFALGTPFSVGREQITPLRPRTIRIGIDANF